MSIKENIRVLFFGYERKHGKTAFVQLHQQSEGFLFEFGFFFLKYTGQKSNGACLHAARFVD